MNDFSLVLFIKSHLLSSIGKTLPHPLDYALIQRPNLTVDQTLQHWDGWMRDINSQTIYSIKWPYLVLEESREKEIRRSPQPIFKKIALARCCSMSNWSRATTYVLAHLRPNKAHFLSFYSTVHAKLKLCDKSTWVSRSIAKIFSCRENYNFDSLCCRAVCVSDAEYLSCWVSQLLSISVAECLSCIMSQLPNVSIHNWVVPYCWVSQPLDFSVTECPHA